MLKKIRVIIAAFFILAITLLFLDYTGTVHAYLGWCARVQFIPALLAFNIMVFVVLMVITFLLGRVYCSTICPLGIFQDIVSRFAGIFKKNRFSYRPSQKIFVGLRFALLGIFTLAVIVNIAIITVLLEPYSAYGRMVAQIFGPAYQLGNNLLAYFAERMDSYMFYTVDVWINSMTAFVTAAVTFIVITIFALKSGRGYCNTICPVGTFLGILARFSILKLRIINREKCVNCSLCVKNCKASCIDANLGKIDYFRCVTCFNCLKGCPKGAIKYVCAKGAPDMEKRTETSMKKSTDELTNAGVVRRGFISGAVMLVLGLFTRNTVQAFDPDGGLVPLEGKRAPARSHPIIPPGADNIRNFRRRCTGCQLCVSVCRNQVLRPSDKVSGFLQPHISFERGYCRPECVKCSQVCPTGAIRPITTAEKSATQIGYAIWQKDLCVVLTDNVSCDLCAFKCPTAAITMIPQSATSPGLPRIPMVDTNRCIGCGACENLCPVRPYSAIYVEGIDTHRTI
ncbi:MAG: 4Fe-4S binding protein [Spirochaetaceae bacterium]|nr:4Fe-4S binding protein [Spirochaetaceae bacterium]